MSAMRLVALLLLLCSCLHYHGWLDAPGSRVRPEISAQHAANPWADNLGYWRGEVAQAIDRWNKAVESVGCSPLFYLSDEPEAHPIRLLAQNEWPHEDRLAGVTTASDADGVGGGIDIREMRPAKTAWPVLAHELGHAAGLGHRSDPSSVMYPEIRWTLVELPGHDVSALDDHLGCRLGG